MRWKDGVIIEKSLNYTVRFEDKSRIVLGELLYIACEMEAGRIDVNELKNMIMEHDQCDEVAAGFLLAQFIIDYGEFIEDEDSYYRIID